MTSQTDTERKQSARLQITYEVDADGEVERREIPFVVGVLADLSGHPLQPLAHLRERKFVLADQDNFDWIVRRVSPRTAFTVPNRLSDQNDESLAIEIRVMQFSDFEPYNVASQVPVLRSLLELRRKLVNLRSRLYGNDKLEDLLLEYSLQSDHRDRLRAEILRDDDIYPSPIQGDGIDRKQSDIIDTIIDESHLASGPEDLHSAREFLTAFFLDLLDGKMLTSRDIEAMITSRISMIDLLVSRQLDEILHHPDFQRLEATWRGLRYLVTNTKTSVTLQIKVLNISKRELERDLGRAVEFDQSLIFRKVYEEEYGSFKGTPFAVLLGDFFFGGSAQDVETLEHMSHIAASTHAPFIAGANPEMFRLPDFTELANPRDLSKIFDNDSYTKWKIFRDSEDARYVGLVLPRILLRLPYGEDAAPAGSFRYREDNDGTDHTRYLWGNSAYAFVLRLTTAFAAHGWCSEILGVEKGGLIREMPVHSYFTDDGLTIKCPTEVPISDRRLSELTNLGFIALCHARGTDSAAFFWAPSCYKAKVFLKDDANDAEQMSSRFEYILALSRFAHYLKAITREKIHTFKTREECQAYLDNWIRQYVAAPGKDDSAVLASAPLANAWVEVQELPGRQGVFRADLRLQPRFQFANQTGQLRIPIALSFSKSAN